MSETPDLNLSSILSLFPGRVTIPLSLHTTHTGVSSGRHTSQSLKQNLPGKIWKQENCRVWEAAQPQAKKLVYEWENFGFYGLCASSITRKNSVTNSLVHGDKDLKEKSSCKTFGFSPNQQIFEIGAFMSFTPKEEFVLTTLIQFHGERWWEKRKYPPIILFDLTAKSLNLINKMC